MILEISVIRIESGKHAEFELAFKEAEPHLTCADSYITHELHRSLQDDDRYVALIEWEAADAAAQHTPSSGLARWLACLQPFWVDAPRGELFMIVAARGMDSWKKVSGHVD